MKINTPNPNYTFEGRPDSTFSDKAVVDETWVENVYQLFAPDFPTRTFIDIGANIGAVSVYVASLNSKIKIYAYEPEDNNFELLKKNMQQVKNEYHLLKTAVSNFSGRGYISDDGGGSGLTDNMLDEQVDVITLKEIFSQNQLVECDVMKVDVEGAEYKIFTNVDVEDLMRIKYLTMEFTNTDAETYGLMLASLSRAFNLHTIGSYDRGGMIYGRRY